MIFLRNCWYAAATVEEMDEGLVARRICDTPVVLYRTSHGALAALEDRCPHRFVPLSVGRREGDALRCAYHGLKFDAAGRCVERPGGADENPADIRVRAFPVTARYGYVWIWMGQPARADADLIPDFSFIVDPQYAVVKGYLHVKAHHELIADNLLDLSHVQYLHPEIASGNHWSEFKNTVKREGDTIYSLLSRPSLKPGALQRILWDSQSEVADGRGDIRWDAPSLLYGNTAFAEVGEDIEATGCKQPSAHLLTPETERTTHYFWVAGRNTRLDDPEIHEMIRVGVSRVFSTQDGPVVEAQQAAMGDSTDFLAQKPLILKADAAGIQARRVLQRRIREEQASFAAQASAPMAAE